MQQDVLIAHLMQGAVERFQLTIGQLTDISRLQQVQLEGAEQVNLTAVVEAVRRDLLPLVAATTTKLMLVRRSKRITPSSS
jgi:signal transduction histidine kinase